MRKTLKIAARALLYAILACLVIFALYPILYALLGSFKTNQEFVHGGTNLLPQNGWQDRNR